MSAGHQGLIEAWRLWLQWFLWFFGLNFLCLGWTVTGGKDIPKPLAALLLVYHLSGIVVTFGLSRHTLTVARACVDSAGFPMRLAALAAFLSGCNLVVQSLFWVAALAG